MKHMGQSIREWTKWNLWKTAFISLRIRSVFIDCCFIISIIVFFIIQLASTPQKAEQATLRYGATRKRRQRWKANNKFDWKEPKDKRCLLTEKDF